MQQRLKKRSTSSLHYSIEAEYIILLYFVLSCSREDVEPSFLQYELLQVLCLERILETLLHQSHVHDNLCSIFHVRRFKTELI